MVQPGRSHGVDRNIEQPIELHGSRAIALLVAKKPASPMACAIAGDAQKNARDRANKP